MVVQLLEALSYKPGGHGDRFLIMSLEFVTDIKSFRRTMALGSNQLLREMTTMHISWGIKATGA
jgi:hypothetical protein